MIVSLLMWDTPYIEALEKCYGEKIVECRTREAALQALPDAEIVVIMGGGGMLIDEEMLVVSKKLRVVLSVSAGIEKLPMASLHARGIAVCNTKGAHAVSIAEFVLGQMLAVSHHFPTFLQQQSQSVWRPIFNSEDLDGKSLLVIGAGSIGTEIGKKAQAFGMTVTGLRRHPQPMEFFDQVYGIAALHEALPNADFVVLVTPLTPETHHLMGRSEFCLMKKSAVFINVSRGDTVDEAALIDALEARLFSGAVLDVFQTEPLPSDSPLWTMNNVVLTPHCAGLSASCERKTTELLCENVMRYQNGLPLLNQVKKGELY